MTLHRHSLFLFLLASCAALTATSATRCQSPTVSIPAGTPLAVKIGEHLPMKVGEPVRAELIYPVYVANHLVLPAGTAVTGSVVSLRPDRSRRIHARLRADFTPFHTPIVQFDHIQLADGTSLPLSTGTATDGAPIYRLVAPPPRKGSFLSQHLAIVKQGIKDRLAVITGPNKLDRLTLLFWSQLPYHPERIATGTAWTVEIASPLSLLRSAQSSTAPAAELATAPPTPVSTGSAPSWMLQAYLDTPISSATSKAGQPIQATVAQPVLNGDGSVAVPVGSVMTGSVTEARPARWFSRSGTLRFSFREIKLPGLQPVAVQAALTGVDSATGDNLTMNSEGEVKPKPQDKLIVPFILLSLASRPLDSDGGANHHMLGKEAVASNSVGLIGFIVGTAMQQPNLAAGFGYYGAAVSLYERLLHRGKEVAFAHDTRIVLQTTVRRSAAIKPDATSIH
jgi:hypothetical protein